MSIIEGTKQAATDRLRVIAGPAHASMCVHPDSLTHARKVGQKVTAAAAKSRPASAITLQVVRRG